MSAKPCCCRPEPRRSGESAGAGAPPGKVPRPGGVLRRGGELAGWVLPTATLALMPKCPACVAGYIVLLTGIGVSLPVAAFLRWSLVVLCLAALTHVVLRRLRRVS